MKHCRLSVFSIALFALLYVILFPLDGHAYIDPGTGSYILQLMAATLLALLFTLKVFWRRIKSFILRMFGGEQPKG